jgi:hypothetical protein
MEIILKLFINLLIYKDLLVDTFCLKYTPNHRKSKYSNNTKFSY